MPGCSAPRGLSWMVVHLLEEAELTSEEQQAYADLREELLSLRREATAGYGVSGAPQVVVALPGRHPDHPGLLPAAGRAAGRHG